MISGNYKTAPFTGNSDYINNLNKVINKTSENNAAVLIVGERGTGKRFIAQRIHFAIDEGQTKRDFYEINCMLPNESDFKMILNGISRFIPAEKKVTLFINHIEFLSEALQNYLLENIQVIRRNSLKVKIVCATELNLEQLSDEGKFNNALLYQINTVVINTIPLRQRVEDIIPLAEYYRNQFCSQSGIRLEEFSESAIEAMEKHFWKGNIDELINCVQRAFMVTSGTVITAEDLGLIKASGETGSIEKSMETGKSLKDAVDQFKKEYITKTLEENNWNQTKTAQILGIQRTYVIKLINELNIRKK